ncbi:MAG: hypothetical protein ABI605_10465 [Rhizobacter sp.]
MNQPPNPVPPRGTRPQLFNAPASKTAAGADAKRHADFGPGILATIDGGQARFSTPRDRSLAKRVLLMGALVLVAAAGYVAVKFNAARPATAPDAVVAHAAVAPTVAKPVEPVASAPQDVAQGAAAIETVTPVAILGRASLNAPPNVAASLSNIKLALDRAEPVKQEKAVSKEVHAARATQATPSMSKPATRAGAAPDDDAELLAAMLPHLKRTSGAPISPTSPTYEKRCGQLAGDAAVDCRARFCSGREGADAACPLTQPAQR